MNDFLISTETTCDLNLDYLEYKSSNGTDLKIKLMPNHFWLSAQESTLESNIV